MVIVDKAAVKDHAVMRFDCSRQYIGGIGMAAAVSGWTHPSFGIGFQNEAAEIGNGGVEFISLGFPPGGHARIEGVEGIESAHGFGATEIYGECYLDTPGAKCCRDAGGLLDEIGSEKFRVGVHVGYGAAVDTEGGKQAGVLTNAGQITRRPPVFPKNRAASVAALDCAIEVVPLVYPAEWRGRSLFFIEVAYRFAQSDFA